MGALLLAMPVLGLWTMALAWFVLPRVRAVHDDRCWSCGYDLSGLAGGSNCPECGRTPNGRTPWIAPAWHSVALMGIPVCGWAGSLLLNPLLRDADIATIAIFHIVPFALALVFIWVRSHGLRCTPWYAALGGVLAATATVVLIDWLAARSNEGGLVLTIASFWCAPASGPGILAGAMIDRTRVRRAEDRAASTATSPSGPGNPTRT